MKKFLENLLLGGILLLLFLCIIIFIPYGLRIFIGDIGMIGYYGILMALIIGYNINP